MTEGVYTILAVPHPAGQRRELVVNKTLLRSVKLGVIGVFLATLLLAMKYHIAALNTIRVEKLRLENQCLEPRALCSSGSALHLIRRARQAVQR